MLKSGLYNVLGAGIRIGLTLATIPLLIRVIGVEEYGLWTLVSAAIGIVGLAEGGLSVSTTVFISKDLANDNINGISQTLTLTFGMMLLLATLAAIALWLGAARLVDLFPRLEPVQQAATVQAFQIGGLVIWGRLLQQVLVGVEQAYQRYKVLNILNTIQAGLSSLGMLGVVSLGGKTIAMMQWQAVTSIGMLVIHVWLVFLLMRGLNLHLMWDRNRGIAIARYSLMTWLVTLSSLLFTQVDRLIVGSVLGPAVLGIYAAITSITTQINSFSALPVQPLLPVLSGLMTKQNVSQLIVQQQVKKAIQINGAIALGIGAALLTLAPIVLHTIIPSATTTENILVFRFAVIIYTFYSLNAVGYYILFSINNAVNICATVQFTSTIISIVMIFFGAFYWNLTGAVIGNIGYVGLWFMTFFGMKKLSIGMRLWLGWIYFPMLCFIGVLLINVAVADNIFIKLTIFVIQSLVFICWFTTENCIEHNFLSSGTKKW